MIVPFPTETQAQGPWLARAETATAIPWEIRCDERVMTLDEHIEEMIAGVRPNTGTRSSAMIAPLLAWRGMHAARAGRSRTLATSLVETLRARTSRQRLG